MADDELVELKAGTRVSNRWTIDKKLGAGSFGAVYLCHNRRGEEAALKTEPINSPHRYLKMEARIMRKIGNERDDVKKHFCRCLELGNDVQPDEKSNKRTTFNYLVMTLVGRGVEVLSTTCNGGRRTCGTQSRNARLKPLDHRQKAGRRLKVEARIMRKIGNERDDVKKHFCRCLELGNDVQPDEKSNKRTTFNYLVMTLVGRGGLLARKSISQHRRHKQTRHFDYRVERDSESGGNSVRTGAISGRRMDSFEIHDHRIQSVED
uniref:Protein kinase domain-containing protein n=1 Tax=Globodera rostochiensis TaxID=31243 RepID=A0A914GV05_GLORO